MIFRRKYDRAVEFQKEKMKGREKASENSDIENVMEKGDKLAMVIAALITIFPVCVILLSIVALLGYFFVVRPW